MKILICANGIGPLFSEENRKRTKEALRLADEISLREPDSLAFVRSAVGQKPVRLTFDPAILAEKTDFPIPTEPYFAVAPKRLSAAFTETLVRTIRALSAKSGLTPILVSLYGKQDLAYAQALSARTGAAVYRPRNAGECIALFSSAQLVISSRLHGLVYATAACCPMMGYSDDEKLFAYLDYIGFGPQASLPCTLSADADADTALQCALRILNRSEYCRGLLSDGIAVWKARARKEMTEALRLLDGPTEQKDVSEHILS